MKQFDITPQPELLVGLVQAPLIGIDRDPSPFFKCKFALGFIKIDEIFGIGGLKRAVSRSGIGLALFVLTRQVDTFDHQIGDVFDHHGGNTVCLPHWPEQQDANTQNNNHRQNPAQSVNYTGITLALGLDGARVTRFQAPQTRAIIRCVRRRGGGHTRLA